MQVSDAPTPPNSLRWQTTIGLITILFGLGGFSVWALMTPLNSAVVTQGVLKVSSERKQVQHFEGGIVKSIFVKEGDRVKQGQALLTLDETFAGADFDILSTELQEMQIREALLIAQRDNLETLSFPSYIESSQANTWLTQQKDSAVQLFQISKSVLSSQLAVLSAQIDQIKSKVAGYHLEIAAKNQQLAFMKEEKDAWQSLLQQKLTNKLRYLELQGDISELTGEIEELKARLASSTNQIQELEHERIRIDQYFRESAANELIEVQIKIKGLSKRIGSASNVLGRIELKAPVEGKIVGMAVHTIGAIIKSGETILEIVPNKDDLIVEVKVMPADIDKVNLLMQAQVRISSYKQHEFPEFMGVVDDVSADVFEDPNTLTSYYTARIIIPEESLAGLPDNKISPGMPAEVMIITGESTPAQYLLEPLLTAFRSAWRDS
jgi:membrane fusion protein, type I secretion system